MRCMSANLKRKMTSDDSWVLDAAARSDDVSSSVTTASVCVVSEDAVEVEVGPPLT
jgi:hypothetical protein